MTFAEQNEHAIRQSIAGEKPDVQPVLFFINFPFIKSLLDVDLHEYFNNPQVMMEAQIETYAKLGLNGPLYPDFGVVPECHALGAQVEFDYLGFPSVRSPLGVEIDAFADLKVADPWAGSMLTQALETLIYMKDHAPSNFYVTNSLIQSPFTAAAILRGISDFCMDVIDEPDAVKQLLSVVTKTDIAFLKEEEKILGYGLKQILIGDDISSFIRPEQFKEFIRPCYDEIYGAFPTAERWLHNDAEALHLSECIADAGFKLWHVGSCFDICEARKRTGGAVSLVGNLVPVKQVAELSEQEVYAAAIDEIKKFDGDPKYILGLGGFISYGTPLENLKAIIRAAQAYPREPENR